MLQLNTIKIDFQVLTLFLVKNMNICDKNKI